MKTYKEFFKTLIEAVYAGNVGMAEIFQMRQKAKPDEWKEFMDHVNFGRKKEAFGVVQRVLKVKLHPSAWSEKEEPTRTARTM